MDNKLENLCKKFPNLKEDITKFKAEVLKTLELYNKRSEEKPTTHNDIEEMLERFAKNEKFTEMYSKLSVIFFTVMLHRVYCIPALIKFLNEYHKVDIKTKERYLEVCKVYLIHFDRRILKAQTPPIDKQQFVPFYMTHMEHFFNNMQRSLERRERKEKMSNIRKLEQLKKNLKKIDLDKMQNIML